MTPKTNRRRSLGLAAILCGLLVPSAMAADATTSTMGGPCSCSMAAGRYTSAGTSRGLRILKFFPSESLGGIPMLEAISAALVGLKFVPTGGISPSNLVAYLRCPVVHAVAGTWLATAKMISSGSFADISRLASEAVAAVLSVRKNGVVV